MKLSQHYFDSYYSLRTKIDEQSDQLSKTHSAQLECRKGCDSCCESINVFPVEYFAIKNELQNQSIEFPKRLFNRFRKSCLFLKDGACTIYHSRPIICRTQGLPLMYQSLKGDGYEVSHCQLNFKGYELKLFTMDNTLFMPDFNSQLFMLNKDYVEQEKLFKKSPTKRLPLFRISE